MRSWIGRALSLCLCLSAAWAQAPDAEDGEGLVIGVFTPWLAFESGAARGRYAADLAAALSAATGLPLKGRAFASSGDFDGQVAAGRLAVALVDAQVQAQRGFPVLAQGLRGGQTAAPLSLVVGAGIRGDGLLTLKGRKLAGVPVGPGDAGFLANFLLQGEVGADFFSAGRGARDVQGAVELVKLGKAEAAFAPAGATGGLRVVFTSRPVPLPVWVQTDAGLPAAALGAIRAALGGLKVAGPLQGFGPVDAGGLRALKAALGPPRRREGQPVIGPAPANLPPLVAFPAAAGVPLVALPAASVGEALAVPPPPPDAF